MPPAEGDGMEINMKKFMDENFLLSTDTAKTLYQNYAADMPIIDYHCHISPEDIAKDIHFDNITQVWLGGDHYKWRQLRSNGVEEYYITGDAPDREKFQKWAETLPLLIGNPLYHWSHMELKTYFGYDGILNGDTAEEVWNICNEKLKDMSAKDIILQSNVECICTTDDPVDTLNWHKEIANSDFPVKVLPAWRPDKIMNIDKNGFASYIHHLSDISGVLIRNFSDLKNAILARMDLFDNCGCRVSDHGLSYVMYEPYQLEEIDHIFRYALEGYPINEKQILKYKTACLEFMAKEYYNRDWVMQLHYGVMRDNNTKQLNLLGVDTGFDSIGDSAPISQLSNFLNRFAGKNVLPKTILYSLNPIDNAAIDSLMGCFQDGTPLGRIQHGAAWWFNDCKQGILDHLISLGNLGVLGNFVGMLTDSRSFLSYTRHDYFRRILCDFIGTLVENGEYPADYDALGKIVQNISYGNAKKYFNF